MDKFVSVWMVGTDNDSAICLLFSFIELSYCNLNILYFFCLFEIQDINIITVVQFHHDRGEAKMEIELYCRGCHQSS